MADNLFEAKYDITKKSKLKVFYESNKTLIYLIITVTIIFLGSLSYYIESKAKKRILLSESYIESRIYLENGKKEEALNILKNVILANDPAYSSLSFFMVLDHNLINDHNEINILFDHLLENNKFDEEIKNLLLYKKALYNSTHLDELKLLEEIKPLLNKKESVWRVHALLLLGDYFVSKKENYKAKDFYSQILSINNLQKDLYDQAKSQLLLISND